MISPNAGPPSGFECARLRIAHLKLGEDQQLAHALETAVAVSAQSLAVGRVGIWVLSEDRQSLASLHAVGRPETHGRFEELSLAGWPAYGAAVSQRRAIVADDARTDPRTRELTESYLVPLGITSMLDVPIFIGGEVWGIVCHEHEGTPRKWTEREIDFAISVADMLSALLEQARRVTLEQELRARDAVLATQRKNAALVQMGAGVAHDFNTVLQTILLLAAGAARSEDQERRVALAQIEEEVGRGGRIVKQLLDLARSTPRSMVPLDLAELVRSMQTSIGALIGPRIALETHATAAAPVLGDRAQLEQTILNLVVNARDAMPGGGTLRVAVTTEDDWAVLSVSDEGVGIPAEVRDRIFEPFFTTRAGEGGTGLGLTTVAIISEQHGGSVSVEPAAPRGTTFSLRIPLRR